MLLLVERLDSIADSLINTKTDTYRHLIFRNENGEQSFMHAPYHVTPMTKRYENADWNLFEHGGGGKYWAYAVNEVGNDFVVMFKSAITSERWVLYHYPDKDTSSELKGINGQGIINQKRKNNYFLIGEKTFLELTTQY